MNPITRIKRKTPIAANAVPEMESRVTAQGIRKANVELHSRILECFKAALVR
jgi:hypothetical protein